MNAHFEQALQHAIARHRQGDLAAAIAAYEALLEHTPDHLSVLANLASALKSAGHLEQAAARFRQALAVDETLPALWFNYGNLHRDQGDRQAAIAAYRRALALDEKLAAAWFNLANLLRDEAQLKEAEQAYRRALQCDPSMARCWMNLGNLLRTQERFDEALAAHQQALARAPQDADIHYNLGNALNAAERLEEAQTHYGQALRLRPDHQPALLALGMAVYQQRQPARALECWRRLLTLNPEHQEAHLNLGTVYRELGNIAAAVEHYRRVLALAPERHGVAVTLASTFLDSGHVDSALELLEPLVEQHGDSAELWKSLGNARAQEARIDQALACYQRALELRPEDRSVVSNLLFSSLYRDWPTPTDLSARHRQMGTELALHAGEAFNIVRRLGDGPLRVGYLSADMRAHPVGFFMEPVFANHNPEAVQVHVYSVGAKRDEHTARLQALVPHWVDAHGWSDNRLGERIIADGVDVLVDLIGHTASNRPWLLIRRAAAVQALYLGYPCTSGLPNVDYLISDAQLSPAEYQPLYTETVMNLPGSFLCFRPPADAPAVASPPHQQQGCITFGSFNHLPKLSPRCRDLWSQVLLAVPDARLVLKSLAMADDGVRKRLLADFQRRGIDPARITLLPPSTPLAVHLADYARLDIGLDPLPYTASTTTCQALWMGVPVLTLAGQHFHERMGASVLHHAGLPEWVAQSDEDFIARAVALAADRDKLTRLRGSLREQLRASVLCDEPGFSRGLETALHRMATASP